ncbi:MAG: hypothetical protein KDC16_12625, partial [Saprospiraceae bacterium]|nr:hypothetical protein [Saprospiraceae bacterium]
TNTSTNSTNQEWFLNGESVSTTADLEWNFDETGSYELCLESSDGYCEETFCQVIFVNDDTTENSCDYVSFMTMGNVDIDENIFFVRKYYDRYVLVGLSGNDISIITLDGNGQIIDNQTIEFLNNVNKSIRGTTIDGDFLLLCGSRKNISGAEDNTYSLKFDLINKKLEWLKIGSNSGLNLSYLSEIIVIPNESYYVMMGQTQPNNGPGYGCDALWIKVDKETGDLIDYINFNLGSCESFVEGLLASNGFIYGIGRFNAFGGGQNGFRPAIMKLDLSGNEIWTRLYLKNITTDDARIYNNSFLEENNNFYIFGQGDNNGISTADVSLHFEKINLDGDVEWIKEYDIVGLTGEFGVKLLSSPDGFYFLTRSTVLPNPGNSFITKVDKNGEFLWSKKIELQENVFLNDFFLDENGIVAVGGVSVSQNGNNKDFIFLRLDLEANPIDQSCVTTSSVQTNFNAILDSANTLVSVDEFKNGFTIQDFSANVILNELSKNSSCEIVCQDTCSNGVLLHSVPDALIANSSFTCLNGEILIELLICNSDSIPLPSATPITIYDNDPTSEVALILGTFYTSQIIQPFDCVNEEILIEIQNLNEVYIVVNDNGSIQSPFNLSEDFPSTAIVECGYTNNIGLLLLDFEEEPLLNLGPNLTLCANEVITLDAGAGFLSYLWSDGFTERIHTIFNEGIHWVEVKTNCGQLLRDSINIQFSEETLINLPDTLYFCENEIKSIGVSGFETYQWLPSEIVSCNDCSETIISTTVDTVIYLTASYETGCYSS